MISALIAWMVLLWLGAPAWAAVGLSLVMLAIDGIASGRDQ